MSFMRGSSNYVWCTTSVLGKGATGAVFQGVNRHTGEPVAVKTFNQLSHMRPQEVQMREFEVLQKVNHENIVKLLAIEEEQEGRGKVIVMELCTGGSLFNILDDPENSHGLEESEYLLVLKHLAAGMKHLRDLNLVHRDLKPGNVMKFIDIDGSTIYKLTDFGAARELDDDQQFLSLYGTEEYLHPDLYERAVLRKPVGKSFGARVDLWSIGVTLFHVATGHLPFRPYGGRRNKETMYLITTEKAPGVISGVQTSENGPIEWSTDIPSACQLSLGLRKLLTPLLAGLLEVNPERMWNFETFFAEVTKILENKSFHLFCVNKAQSLIVYLHERDTIDTFKSLVKEQTDIEASDQLLIWKNRPLEEYVGCETFGRDFPTTNLSQPIIVVSKSVDDITLRMPDFQPLKFPNFPSIGSVEHDANVGKTICSVADGLRRRIEYFCRLVSNTEQSVTMFAEYIASELRTLNTEMIHLRGLTIAVSERFSQLVANHRRFLVLLQMIGPGSDGISSSLREKLEDLVNNKVEDEKDVRENLESFVPIVDQHYSKVVTEGQLQKPFHLTMGTSHNIVKKAPNKAQTFVMKLRESWQHLLRDRAARSLTLTDEQFHHLEKLKMKETMAGIDHVHGQMTVGIRDAVELLADWCKVAKVHRVQTEIEKADIVRHQSILENFQDALSKTEEEYHYTLSEILGSVKDLRIQDISDTLMQGDSYKENSQKDASTSIEPSKAAKSLLSEKKCKKSLKEISSAQDLTLRLLQENTRIIKEFECAASRNLIMRQIKENCDYS